MKKYLVFIILAIIFGLLFLIKYFNNPDIGSQLKEYLLENGYKETEYENILLKNDSLTKKHTFSLDDYTYMLNIEDKIDVMPTSLNATYNFKSEDLIYSYRINYKDNVNVYFKGTFKDDKFTCNKEFSTSSLTDKEINNICDLIEVDIKLFDIEAKTLFTKYKFIDYIKNK